jgi:tetratricopeptide (TPR) repeat protein
VSATDRLIQTGAQPLAQIAQRGRNAHTGSAMCQTAAHHLAEAGAALAASYWFARHRDSGPGSAAVSRALSAMLARGPSFGTWVGLLRESASAVGAGALASLAKPLSDRDAIDRLAAALVPKLGDTGPFGSKGASLKEPFARAQKGGALGFFDFLVAFRNAVYGHSWMLPEAESRALAVPFLEAVSALLIDPVLFEESWLAQPSSSFLASSRPQWKRLSGLYVEFVDPIESGLPPPEGAALSFVAAARVLRAPFFVVAEEDATGLSKFGFLSRLIKPGAVKEIEYLDYVSGPFRSSFAVEEARELSIETVESEPEPPASSHERRLGDFIVDESSRLGSGAMGEVFRASQPSLCRDVALKLLPPTLSHDPVKMGRFNREVQALARCDHPNVVHVYAFGIEDSRPWFAMELIEGEDLSKRIAASPERTSDFFVRTARLFAGASSGLAEIHRRGVIHRDIKPSNLMITASSDRLVIMDLGLAKTTDHSSAYTRSEGREFVGSVLYAAPEQIEANLLVMDHRADVYGLGATLYEFLTQKPLFEGSVEQVLQQKLRKEPKPPRAQDPRIPSDLEIVVLKAIARDPSARYATAEAMAEDLLAFAEGKPIAARRQSWTYHLRMFQAQNRGLVRMMAAAIASIAIVVTWAFIQISGERAAADRHRRSAEGLMNFMLTDLRDKLEPIGKLALLDEVAKRTMGYYESIPTDDANAEAARLRSVALDNLGDVRLAQGDTTGAMEQYRAAEAIRIRRPEARDEMAISMDKIGDAALAQGDTSQALERYQRALQIRDALAASSPENPKVQRGVHVSHTKIGNVLAKRGKTDEALEHYRSARAIMERLSARDSKDAKAQIDLARVRTKIAALLLARRDLDGALEEYRAALAIDRKVSDEDPSNLSLLHEVAFDLSSIGDVLLTKGEIEPALAHYRDALILREKLASLEPEHAGWQRSLSAGLQKVGDVLAEREDFAGALVQYRPALAIAERLAALDEANAERQRDLCVSLNNVGDMMEALGDRAGALEAYRRYLSIAQRLAEKDPTNVGWQRDLSVAHGNVGRALLAGGARKEALEHGEADLAIAKDLAEKDPNNPERQRDLSMSHESMGDLLLSSDRARALAEYRAARALMEKLKLDVGEIDQKIGGD